MAYKAAGGCEMDSYRNTVRGTVLRSCSRLCEIPRAI